VIGEAARALGRVLHASCSPVAAARISRPVPAIPVRGVRGLRKAMPGARGTRDVENLRSRASGEQQSKYDNQLTSRDRLTRARERSSGSDVEGRLSGSHLSDQFVSRTARARRTR